MRQLPNLNPFLAYLADAVTLLNEACTAQGQAAEFRLSRSSTFHCLGALHAAGNALLYFEEDSPGLRQSPTLVLKFDRVFEVKGLESLPASEHEILEELDAVASIIQSPKPALARPFKDDSTGRRIEFKRTPLKKFNRESTGWPVDYAGCTLALAIRFLNRLFYEHLKLDESWTEILLGHHLQGEDNYAVTLDKGRLAQLQQDHSRLMAQGPLMSRLASERWQIQPAYFALHPFLLKPAR